VLVVLRVDLWKSEADACGPRTQSPEQPHFTPTSSDQGHLTLNVSDALCMDMRVYWRTLVLIEAGLQRWRLGKTLKLAPLFFRLADLQADLVFGRRRAGDAGFAAPVESRCGSLVE
jgi:hypothetical protein